MQFIDEFRDPQLANALVVRLAQLAEQCMQERDTPIQIMEFCGGHTHTIFRFGLEQLLPASIELVHGPGCPVCVLPRQQVDQCIAIAQQPNVIMTTFGDAMRVPGSKLSLLEAKASGCDIRMVYSPLDALELAKQSPQHEVVFFALGFETTMPSTALTVLQAQAEGVQNFSLFCNHITTAPTLQSILEEPDHRLDGFIAPGHVSMVMGDAPFQFVAQQYQRPIIITGFEPLDILQALVMLLEQLCNGRSEVENQYQRIVKQQGNPPGLAAMQKVFELSNDKVWQAVGSMENSTVRMSSEFSAFDAEQKFSICPPLVLAEENPLCEQVLKGLVKPWQCPMFGKACTPQQPQGALMVSSEGVCAAYYQYADHSALSTQYDESVLARQL